MLITLFLALRIPSALGDFAVSPWRFLRLRSRDVVFR